MQTSDLAQPSGLLGDWRDYFALLKPRVMTLVIFTAACAMLAAPGALHPFLGFTAILCIAVAAGAAGALNQWYEADIDAVMKRTAQRPLPAGRLAPGDWLAVSILFYVVVYTAWLKRRTPQNIVIGGAAGAFPVICGWAAVAGDTPLMAWILFAIIFLWTPPHFWALALFMEADYARAGVPMLPVTHGLAETRRQIFGYSIALVAMTLAPLPLGLAGWAYGSTALALGAMFIALAVPVARNRAETPAGMAPEKKLFKFSLLYLAILFGALVADSLLA
jgi:protoheme IX farnesyltransferase